LAVEFDEYVRANKPSLMFNKTSTSQRRKAWLTHSKAVKKPTFK
jgi:hypothetical protein